MYTTTGQEEIKENEEDEEDNEQSLKFINLNEIEQIEGGKIYVQLNVKQLLNALDLKKEVVLTMLN